MENNKHIEENKEKDEIIDNNLLEKKEEVKTNEENPKKKQSFFNRLNLKKIISKSEPMIDKGKTFSNLHSNFSRDKDKEPEPSLFPRKTKIVPWQEQNLEVLDDVSIDFDMNEDLSISQSDKNTIELKEKNQENIPTEKN